MAPSAALKPVTHWDLEPRSKECLSRPFRKKSYKVNDTLMKHQLLFSQCLLDADHLSSDLFPKSVFRPVRLSLSLPDLQQHGPHLRLFLALFSNKGAVNLGASQDIIVELEEYLIEGGY